jgi:hypothetical protein
VGESPWKFESSRPHQTVRILSQALAKAKSLVRAWRSSGSGLDLISSTSMPYLEAFYPLPSQVIAYGVGLRAEHAQAEHFPRADCGGHDGMA